MKTHYIHIQHFYLSSNLSVMHTCNSFDRIFIVNLKRVGFIVELQFTFEFIFFVVPFSFRYFKSACYGEHSCWLVLDGIRVCRHTFDCFFASNYPCYAHMVWVEVLGHTHKSDCLLTALLSRGFYNCDIYVIFFTDFKLGICKIL